MLIMVKKDLFSCTEPVFLECIDMLPYLESRVADRYV